MGGQRLKTLIRPLRLSGKNPYFPADFCPTGVDRNSLLAAEFPQLVQARLAQLHKVVAAFLQQLDEDVHLMNGVYLRQVGRIKAARQEQERKRLEARDHEDDEDAGALFSFFSSFCCSFPV